MKTRRTTLPIVLIYVAALVSGACLAKDNARESALRAAEIARFEAAVKADDAALDRLLDADLQYTHSTGELESKSRFIAALHDGTRDYVAFEPDIQTLRVIGDVGLIHGEARVTVASGKATSTFRISYDDAWLWKDGRWQMTAWRSTRLADPPPSARSEAGARDAVLARFDAALQGNLTALQSLLAVDLDYCSLNGECITRDKYIEDLRSGRIKYRSIAPTVNKVKMSADRATVLGRATVTAVLDGAERTRTFLFAADLDWRDGRWQLTTWTTTELGQQSK